MKSIEDLLQELVRPEVAEFAIVSNRLPCVKVGAEFHPIDDFAPNSEGIVEMLIYVGGSRYVDDLMNKPAQWKTRIDGIGMISVSALRRGDIVQARMTVLQREPPKPKAAPPPPEPPRAVAPPPPPPPPQPEARPASRAGFSNAKPNSERQPSVGGPASDPGSRLGESPFGSHAPSSGSGGGAGAGQAPSVRFSSDGHDESASLRSNGASGATMAGAQGVGGAQRGSTSNYPPAISPMAAPMQIAPMQIAPMQIAPMQVPSISNVAHGPPAPAPFMPLAAAADQLLSPRQMSSQTAARYEEMLSAARTKKASDLHIVSARPALFRIAGDLQARGLPVESSVVEEIICSVVPPRLLPLLDKDGSADFAFDQPNLGRFRANVTRQRTGFKMTLRLLPKDVPTLGSLGLPEQIAQATHHHQGLILVTGPAGHGKTSTMAAIVNLINTETTHHLITVEDPIEYVHPRKRSMMSQREVGSHTKTFAAALKASLREDPDVIVVGELRDTETVKMALSASETGHLVIGTMNTPSAAKTIDRMIDLFPPSDQAQVRMTLAGGLRLIISQRLLPNADRSSQVAAVELLTGTIPLWNLIRDSKTYQIPSLQQRGKGLGIIRLDESLAELVKTGKTTLDSAKLYADSADEVEAIALNKRPVAKLPDEIAKEQKGAAGSAGNMMSKAGSLFKKG